MSTDTVLTSGDCGFFSNGLGDIYHGSTSPSPSPTAASDYLSVLRVGMIQNVLGKFRARLSAFKHCSVWNDGPGAVV